MTTSTMTETEILNDGDDDTIIDEDEINEDDDDVNY